MILSEFGIKRPITVLMIFIGVTVIGLVSLINLNIDLFPDMSLPIVAVMTEYSGAGPAEVESMVNKPLEAAISMVRNIKNVTSTSKEGSSLLIAQFDWGTDVDAASIDIREKIDLVRDHLPGGVGSPMVVKYDPALMPILVVGISSPRGVSELKQFAEDNIKDKVARLDGVAAVVVQGGMDRQIHVNIDRNRMEGLGISFDQVKMALAAANLNLPGGHLRVGNLDYLIRTPGEYKDIKQVGATVIGNRNGVPISLRDIAEVKDAYAERDSETRIDGVRSVVMVVQKQSGSNTVEVSNRVQKKLAELQKGMPSDIKLSVAFDSSIFIRRSIKSLQSEAVIGAILAILIIMLFLRNWSSTMIIGISIPFSIIATFVMMYFQNMTLNIMTLGGLALGVGRLVDDSIVVLENIYRHREEGHDAREAALQGSSQVAMAVLAATITTIVVFIPIAFVSGIAGVMFKPMSYTVSFSLIASYFVSMMLIPLLSKKFMKVESNDQMDSWLIRNWLNKFNKWLKSLDIVYQNIISWAIRHKKQVIGITLGIVLLTISLIWPLKLVDTEFIPKSDENEFSLSLAMPVGTSFAQTGKIVRQLEDIVREDIPETRVVYSVYGEGEGMRRSMSSTGPNYADMRVKLVNRSERKRGVEEIVEGLRAKFARIPDAKIIINTGGMMSQMMSFGAGGAVQVDIQGYDMETGQKLARQVKEIISGIKGTRDVDISRKEGIPELKVMVDRDKAGSLGLSVYQVAGTVETAFKGNVVSRFRDSKFGKEYDIVVRLQERDRDKLRDLSGLFIMSPLGHPVALSNVARIEKAFGPVDIQRKNQQRIISVTCDVAGRAVGVINQELTQKLKKLTVPEGFTIEVSGSAKDMADSFKSLFYAMLLAIMLVYMVLASQFESLLDPFVIMFSVPLGIIGVIWGLFFTGINFSVIAFIGVIMLVGMVVSNAILLVDYANVLKRQGMELYQAVITSGRTRLRPILMTTLTTIFGMVPMALGIGESGETYAPLAVSVIGGLAASTVLTLVFVPTLYIILEERLKK
ncbi:MAG: efflux RND transporter permease subunit [Candidatus Edwardsbacteria bacterium]|nr:efflux RND transporter permease subunit [Candidatus Edwardsbacteria bacterium]MBU1577762.1 efflux RND transporter permease subunit [Candidatus Edwardsbacteria bacterium]MBU2463119.1 efflux RND transporter permease subunit [Candidatus Edwardsbacteria bacterium]MBU2594708.1 efflux RND transporter permease subunit [Candidatus Edwardsbacteria bacterium]